MILPVNISACVLDQNTLFLTYIEVFIRPQKFAVLLWYDAVVGVVVGVCRQVGFRTITFVLVNQSF